MGTPTLWTRVRAFVLQHRRRFASAALMAFLVAVAIEVGSVVPRDVEISVPMGAQHAEVREARIEYSIEGEAVRSVTRRFRQGAPREVRDSVSLSPGNYEVTVLVIDREGLARELEGRFSAPAEGVVRLALEGT